MSEVPLYLERARRSLSLFLSLSLSLARSLARSLHLSLSLSSGQESISFFRSERYLFQDCGSGSLSLSPSLPPSLSPSLSLSLSRSLALSLSLSLFLSLSLSLSTLNPQPSTLNPQPSTLNTQAGSDRRVPGQLQDSLRRRALRPNRLQAAHAGQKTENT